ncbi:hypothetical protein SDC9_54339 [bioreactor metagenome]|uniref:Uncharacterized protein n=1 Tax=bioreactor metagenome TaxID=1076179 RepID=A0A644WWF8_9ZZZZ
MQHPRHNGVQVLHRLPDGPEYFCRYSQGYIPGAARSQRRFKVIQVAAEACLLAARSQAEVADALHERLTSSHEGRLKSEVLCKGLTACQRGGETHSLENGEVDQAVVMAGIGGECMAVDRVPLVATVGCIALAHHVGVAAVGTEGPYLLRKIEFRVVVVTNDGVVLDAGLNPQSDVYNIVDEGDGERAHQVLQEMKALSARGDQKFLIADLAFLCDDEPVLRIHALHRFAEGELDSGIGEPGKQLLDQEKAAVGSQVGLLDLQEGTAEALSPLLIDFNV